MAVPAQRFLITAEVVRGRQIPIVQDFALRLLRVADSMETADFQAFFGWNGRELTELLGELLRAELVTETNGRLRLGTAGTMVFQGADDPVGPPVAIQSQLVKEYVGFDKVSFNLAPTASREPHVASLPLLQIVDRTRAAFATKEVPEALRRNWREFSEGRFSPQGQGPDPELQAILEVEPKAHFLSEVVVPVILQLQGEVRAEPNFSALEALGREGSRKELIASAARYAAALNGPADDSASLQLLRSIGLPLLDRFGAGAPAGAWARYALSDPKFDEERRPTVALCGSVVSPMVRTALLDRTAVWEASLPSGDGPILWLRPSLRQWGVGESFTTVASTLARRARGPNGLVLVCRFGEEKMPPGTRSERLVESGFSASVSVSGGHLPGSLEILLSPGRWALVLVHKPVTPGGLPIGGGFCSGAPTVVAGVSTIMRGFLAQPNVLRGRRGPDGENFDPRPMLRAALQDSAL
jgi:hypothetical protein